MNETEVNDFLNDVFNICIHVVDLDSVTLYGTGEMFIEGTLLPDLSEDDIIAFLEAFPYGDLMPVGEPHVKSDRFFEAWFQVCERLPLFFAELLELSNKLQIDPSGAGTVYGFPERVARIEVFCIEVTFEPTRIGAVSVRTTFYSYRPVPVVFSYVEQTEDGSFDPNKVEADRTIEVLPPEPRYEEQLVWDDKRIVLFEFDGIEQMTQSLHNAINNGWLAVP